MFSDVFSKKQALALLKGKKIWFIGSSNMRAIYKDLLWLITHGSIAEQTAFKIKNEERYLNDRRLTNDKLHNGVNYVENRIFMSKDVCIYYHFITRLYLDNFLKLINGITEESCPDIILLNSCLWDLARWGGDGAKNYRKNLLRTMMLLKTKLPPKVRVIWKTALPVSVKATGALFTEDISYIVPVLPWFIQQANLFAAKCASFFNYDTLDLHFYMRMQGHLRVKDGIHWRPIAVRYLTNVFLTHVCLSLDQKLPGNFIPSQQFLGETTQKPTRPEIIQKRVEDKAVFFKKLFAASTNIIKKTGKFPSGIKNVIVKASKKVLNAQKLKHNIQNAAKNCFNKQTERFDGVAEYVGNKFNKNKGQYDLNQARNAYDQPSTSSVPQLSAFKTNGYSNEQNRNLQNFSDQPFTSANNQRCNFNYANPNNNQQNYKHNTSYNYKYKNGPHYKYNKRRNNTYFDDYEYNKGQRVYKQYRF